VALQHDRREMGLVEALAQHAGTMWVVP
jgi:hypothetical protein